MSYIYASFHTREAAELALEDMFARGEVFECELDGIRKRGNRWLILLWE